MKRRGILLAGMACFAGPALAAPPPAIIAHRGLAAGIPENTLAALRRSVDRGVSIIEIDVRTTGDGQLVILHDETLDRTTDCAGRLKDRSLAEIKRCDAGWPSHPGERVPTLAEALAFIKSTPARLLLDIKPGTAVGKVVASIREHRAESNVILGLRRASDIAFVRRELPAAGTLAFMPRPTDAPAFVDAGAQILRLWSDWVEADPTLVGRTTGLGAKVWIMIGRRLPSREAAWRALHGRMIASGAQGLITNRPDLISTP